MQLPLKVVFFGTPDLGVPTLRALHADARFSVVAAISQPDRPQGRKQELLPTPIKAAAVELGIPVYQPERLRDDALALLRSFDADYFVLIAYGKLLKQEVLDMPRIAPVNAHVSLLPKWRGASPIQASLLAGDAETGVTYMRMTAGMDEGPMLAQKTFPLGPRTTAGEVFDGLGLLAAQYMGDVLMQYAEARMETPQDDTRASHCGKLSKEMGQISWSTMSALEIYRRWQAFTPWPSIFTFGDGRRFKLLDIDHVEAHLNLAPGEIRVYEQAVFVGTVHGEVRINSLQPEGKKPMKGADYFNGAILQRFQDTQAA